MRPARYYIDDYGENCYCSRCETYHPCEEHHRDKRTPTGYAYNCKATSKKYGSTQSQKTFQAILKKESDEMLVKMGYDPTSSIPVYEQFLIKHDL